MMFKDLLINFSEGKISEKNFKTEISSFKYNIWKVGLVEEEFHLCVQIFLEFEKLDDDVQNQLLNCMVPREKIPAETVKALLAWFFSNKGKCINGSKNLLSWFSVMLSSSLIDCKPLEKLFNQFLVCFYWTELVPAICSVLKHIVKPETVSRRSVFIASNYYYQPVLYPEKKHIGTLLRLFHSCSPTLVLKPPPGNLAFPNSRSEFQKAVTIFAFELGYLNTLPDFILHKSIKTTSTTNRQAHKQRHHLPGAEVNEAFLEAVDDLSGDGGMKSLGQMIIRKKVPAVQNTNSLLGSRTGQIYVCWQNIVGNELQSKELLSSSPDWRKILEVCQRMRTGWSALPTTLSKFFITWDGEESGEVLYSVIPFISCGSFEDLYKNVLFHILNIFFTGTMKDKINIIDCLTKMIAYKVNSEARDTTMKLIKFVCRLLKIELASDGLQCTALLFSSLTFYQRISILEENYMLGTWTIPPPFLVFGAFLSNNHVLISDVCELIVRHNVVMFPFYISVGMIEHFRDEEEIVKTYLRDLYLFLWKGKARNTELFSDVEDHLSFLLPKEIDSIFSIRSHYGIQHLVAYIISRGKLKHLNDKSLMKVINTYAPGLSAVKSAYEGSIRESTST